MWKTVFNIILKYDTISISKRKCETNQKKGQIYEKSFILDIGTRYADINIRHRLYLCICKG